MTVVLFGNDGMKFDNVIPIASMIGNEVIALDASSPRQTCVSDTIFGMKRLGLYGHVSDIQRGSFQEYRNFIQSKNNITTAMTKTIVIC